MLLFLSGGRRGDPDAGSSRMALIITRIPPLFLVLAYSGIIISFITVRIIQPPFQNLEQLIEDGTFKIGYQNLSYSETWLKVRNYPMKKSGSKKAECSIGKKDLKETYVAMVSIQ